MIDKSLTEERENLRLLTKEINKKQREVYNLISYRTVLQKIFHKRQCAVKQELKKLGVWEGSNFRDEEGGK